MNGFIDAVLSRRRTVVMLFVLIMLMGTSAVLSIPKESNPDITVPFVYVSVVHTGISPEDADKLIYKPLEKQLRGIDGLKEMVSTATYGHLSIQLEFYTDTDIDQALNDVRVKVDNAKGELPADTEEPVVMEINVALFPVMVVTLSGLVDENVLYIAADRLKDRIEALPGVLEVNIRGKREQIGEIIIDPARMDNYDLTLGNVATLFSNNSLLVASEDLDNDAGRFGIKVPGQINDIRSLMKMPVKKSGDNVVLFEDIAIGRLGFKDQTTGAKVNGERAVALEITKRIGSNIIETLDSVREIAEQAESQLPQGIDIKILQDESKQIKTMLNDLFNSVLTSTLLVMILILGSLGLRNSVLVGLAIPGAFLMAIIVLSSLGYTMNMVVLFALILSVGMLVDGAIVITEYADRRLAEGAVPKVAYREASQRMSWPIIASTATTLAVFLPLLVWPDTVGEFMKFLPLTLLFTLSASLIMALIVIPAMGTLISRAGHHDKGALKAIEAAESGDFSELGGFSGGYVRVLSWSLHHPWKVTLGLLATVLVSFVIYGANGHGTEFFPDVDADVGMVDIRARGNLSFAEREALVQTVEERIFDMGEIKSIYTSVFASAPGDSAQDLIGRLQLEFVDWESRRPANDILSAIEERTRDLPGLIVETRKQEGGPGGGADLQLQLTGSDPEKLQDMLAQVRTLLEQDEDLKDIRDDRPLEGVEWRILIDREAATRYGASVSSLGSLIRMTTGGQIISQFQPEQADEEIDVVLRYPPGQRNLDQFENINVHTEQGQIPASNFMTRTPFQKSGDIVRIDGKRRYLLQANVQPGINAAEKINGLTETFKDLDWVGAGVTPKFRGDFEQMASTGAFLASAFGVAIFLMVTILVTQFNSFYQAGLIMSAIVLSIAGVLMGLLIRGEPFGIVMSGVGVIALAGIVVNNNIVLIDTYNYVKNSGVPPLEAALRTGAMRMRPVLLTAVTTVIGLMPMVLQWNIDLINQHFSVGAPSSQWWTQLSTAIAGGLTFATVLTLILTPCLLVLRDRKKGAAQAETASH